MAVIEDELLGRLDDPERVGLGFGRGVAPGGDAVAAENAADRRRVGLFDLRDVEPELPARPAPWHPDDLLAEGLRGEGLPVRGGSEGDAGIWMQVVDMGGIHQPVHCCIDRRCCTALAVQRVVEGGDHLVFAVDSPVDLRQRAKPIEAQHREAGLGEGAEVSAGALDPEKLYRLARCGVDIRSLGGGVSARIVRDPRVGAESVAPGDELSGCGVGHGVILFVEGTGALASDTRAQKCPRAWHSAARRGANTGVRRPRRPAGHRPGRRRSSPGSRMPHRSPSDRRRVRGSRARRRGRRARRCRRRP